jgi:cytosine/adenosine deaminase-related metal-dependent hydrolase
MVWPTLVGHTSASDELWCAAAAAARERGTQWSFHMSPGRNDGDVFRSQTGEDPLVHLDRLGVLDDRAVIAHAIHISEAELQVLNRSGASVAFCPASNLAHASGVTHAAKHDRMAHVALGTDSPHRVPLLQQTGLICSLFGDLRDDRTRLMPERALEWVTLNGARALGLLKQIGSLEVGKRADVAVFEVSKPIHNVANALVHHTMSGRAVHVFIDGEHVVCDGHFSGGDRITSEAITAGERLARRAGFPTRTGWPVIE